jgi:hypothetical protein
MKHGQPNIKTQFTVKKGTCPGNRIDALRIQDIKIVTDLIHGPVDNPCWEYDTSACATAEFRIEWRVATTHPKKHSHSNLAHCPLLEMPQVFSLCSSRRASLLPIAVQ